MSKLKSVFKGLNKQLIHLSIRSGKCLVEEYRAVIISALLFYHWDMQKSKYCCNNGLYVTTTSTTKNIPLGGGNEPRKGRYFMLIYLQ